jgi:hypothetical protein
MNVNLLKSRWVEIEDRAAQLVDMLSELEEVNEEVKENNIKTTKAFMLLQQELKLLYVEQNMINKSGALKE